MENTNRDTAQNAAPQNERQDAEKNASSMQDQEFHIAEPTYDSSNDQEELIRYAMASTDDPDPDKDKKKEEEEEEEKEKEEEEKEKSRDWGHIDPAEGNSPFRDSNAPGFPGSAV
jgi:hypothetical protein